MMSLSLSLSPKKGPFETKLFQKAIDSKLVFLWKLPELCVEMHQFTLP